MITEKLQNAINEQITAEMWSSNLYLAMSFYMEKEGYCGMASWLKNNHLKSTHMHVNWLLILLSVVERLRWTRLMLFQMILVLHWKSSSRFMNTNAVYQR